MRTEREKCSKFNPCKPSVLFVGHRQTVQTQSAASDQDLHCLLTECSVKIGIK